MIRKFYYNAVKLLARISVILFYRPIEINGLDNIPSESPHLIFAPNHQSAFLDAIIVAVFSKRPIHFLTRADVFIFPFKYFLKSLNMMPVYRIRDGYKTLSKNEAVFNTCRELIRAGKPILLFPEASQELVFYLRPLSRGMSRIAYIAQKDFDKPVYIIPVGLNYFHQLDGGVKLTLNFGKPVNVKQIIEETDGETECLNTIRDLSFNSMKETLLIPEKTDHYERDKKFLNRSYYSLSFERLKALIHSDAEPMMPKSSYLARIAIVILGLFNLWFHLISFLIIKFFVSDETFYASIKLSLIMFLLPVGQLLISCFVASAFGWPLALLCLSIQILSFVLRQALLKYWY